MDGFDGRKDSLYVGVAPVVYDGEIKAVITLEYSYASFLDRRSVRYNEYQYFKKKDGIAGQNEPS